MKQVVSVLELGRDGYRAAAFGAGVPFLMLAGNLVSGWQLAKAPCWQREAALARGEDPAFMQAKIATARFYGDHILCECTR